MDAGRGPGGRDLLIFVLVAAVVLLVSPLRALWAHLGAPWWAPFAVWALLIAAGGVAVERWGRR